MTSGLVSTVIERKREKRALRSIGTWSLSLPKPISIHLFWFGDAALEHRRSENVN